MTFLAAATYTFAAIGVASVLYVLYQWLGHTTGEDGPIRVRGGSITIDNDDFSWVKDDADDDNDNQYHLKGGTNRFIVHVRKNGQICNGIDGIEARRVKLEVGGNNDKVIFKPNGAVRVVDGQKRFVASGKELTDNSPSAHVKRVVVRKLDGGRVSCEFSTSDTCEIDLVPKR